MRFNNLDADIPGQTFQFPTAVEGAVSYDNAIALTQPMYIDDLKYPDPAAASRARSTDTPSTSRSGAPEAPRTARTGTR
ncbi:hypothetical protein AB0D67_10175 [Streptosporangium sp. NPDC048047]|uniref:hypothetical protein n=1 Tax=Streptosporangium sp. NPDC048047 TaxID=3155748 RepID=UPI0034237C74